MIWPLVTYPPYYFGMCTTYVIMYIVLINFTKFIFIVPYYSDDESDKKKNKGKKKKKSPDEVDNEAFEDSDDGEGEGREVDYMSDESSDEEEIVEAQHDIAGVLTVYFVISQKNCIEIFSYDSSIFKK